MQRHPPAGHASSVEVYGFAAWIASAIGFVFFIAWAYLPDSFLRAAGVTYYPDKQWALLLPTWVLCSILFMIWTYESLNQISVVPFASTTTIRDKSSKTYRDLRQASNVHSIHTRGAGTTFGLPLMHIPPSVVSRVLYGGQALPDALEEEGLWSKAKGM